MFSSYYFLLALVVPISSYYMIIQCARYQGRCSTDDDCCSDYRLMCKPYKEGQKRCNFSDGIVPPNYDPKIFYDMVAKMNKIAMQSQQVIIPEQNEENEQTEKSLEQKANAESNQFFTNVTK